MSELRDELNNLKMRVYKEESIEKARRTPDYNPMDDIRDASSYRNPQEIKEVLKKYPDITVAGMHSLGIYEPDRVYFSNGRQETAGTSMCAPTNDFTGFYERGTFYRQ